MIFQLAATLNFNKRNFKFITLSRSRGRTCSLSDEELSQGTLKKKSSVEKRIAAVEVTIELVLPICPHVKVPSGKF